MRYVASNLALEVNRLHRRRGTAWERRYQVMLVSEEEPAQPLIAPDRFATREVLEFDPLPCWRSLSATQYQQKIADLVDSIIASAEARRKESGKEPAGATAIRSQNPTSHPAKTKKSPAPLVHAASRRVRQEIYRMYGLFVAAFREAAEQLKAGDRSARFPEGSFPHSLPFVKACFASPG